MKTLYISILTLLSLTLSTSINAQTASKLPVSKDGLKQDSLNTFMSFSPVSVSGKVYVRWMVKNDRKDGLFVVERSEDGQQFEALGVKDRVGSQLDVNLFYSYVDEYPVQGYGHYRILQVGQDNTYRYSDVVKVKSDIQPKNTTGSATNESK